MRFFSSVDLENSLEQEKLAGKQGRLAYSPMHVDVVVFDNWDITEHDRDHDFGEGKGHHRITGSEIVVCPLHYMLRRYWPPTSNSAWVICPSEHTRTASISTSNTFLLSITACCRRLSIGAQAAWLRV